MCPELYAVISISACAVTACAVISVLVIVTCTSMLPTRITGHVFGEHRVQFVIPDPILELGDYALPVSVSVYFYAKEDVQMAYKLGATSRVIQRKFL